MSINICCKIGYKLNAEYILYFTCKAHYVPRNNISDLNRYFRVLHDNYFKRTGILD